MTDAQRNLLHVLMGSFPGIPGELAEELTDAVLDFVKNAMANPDAAPFRETLDRARAALDKCPMDNLDGCGTAGKCGSGHECAEPCPTCAASCDKTPPVKPVLSRDRGDLLREAHRIINGERQGQYGSPEDSFELIARFWNNYLRVAGKRDNCMTPRDVAMLMILLKVAREAHAPKRDNLVDIIGYAALADM